MKTAIYLSLTGDIAAYPAEIILEHIQQSLCWSKFSGDSIGAFSGGLVLSL